MLDMTIKLLAAPRFRETAGNIADANPDKNRSVHLRTCFRWWIVRSRSLAALRDDTFCFSLRFGSCDAAQKAAGFSFGGEELFELRFGEDCNAEGFGFVELGAGVFA